MKESWRVSKESIRISWEWFETDGRPPFMDEFEKLEKDLRISYDEYVDKFRCLSYLEQQWQELDKNEQQELEERQVISFQPLHSLEHIIAHPKWNMPKNSVWGIVLDLNIKASRENSNQLWNWIVFVELKFTPVSSQLKLHRLKFANPFRLCYFNTGVYFGTANPMGKELPWFSLFYLRG